MSSNFQIIGFKDKSEYVKHFFDTLLISNKTFEYFVDWQKVKNILNKHLNEFCILNSLTKVDRKEKGKKLYELLLEFPNVVKTIPFLIAERINKIQIFDEEIEKIITFDFSPNNLTKEKIDEVIHFCKKVGILNLFDEVKDIYDYILGIEVGIDTNYRKNRSGEIFEKMCKNKITKMLKNYTLRFHDKDFSLVQNKIHDIIVYDQGKPIAVIECNFYNTAGSKPISIAESYIEMEKIAQEKRITFIWITDGPGWKHMKGQFLKALNRIRWIFNYSMIHLIEKVI